MHEIKELKEKEEKDCCKSHGSQGKKEARSYFMPAILGILLIIAIFQAMQISAIKSITGNAVKAGSNANGIDMTGWTENEKMNYEMHGLIPSRVSASGGSSPSGAGMVGGC